MLPTPVPPIVEVAPIAIGASQGELIQLVIGGATALAALVGAVAAVVGLFHLKTIHIEFNSMAHRLLEKTESLALVQGANAERERSEKAQDQSRKES